MVDAGANFCKGVKNGNQISPKGSNRGSKVAELSRAEIEEEGIDPETELVIEELAEGARVRELDEDEHYLKLDLDSDKADKFFSESELSELQSKERTLKGESEPESIEEVWDGIREGVKAHNREVAKNKKELEKKRIRKAMEDPALSKKFKNMNGSEIKRVMNSDDESSSVVDEEELQSALNQVDEKYEAILEDSDPDIKDPSVEIEELVEGLEAWRERAEEKPYWVDFVEDLQESDESTMYVSIGPNSKRVTTQDEELMHALRNYKSEPFDGDVEIEEDTGETVIAVVKED